VAQDRAAQVRRAQRILSGVLIAVIVAVIVEYVVVKNGMTHHSEATRALSPAVARDLSSVPSGVLDQVGTGASSLLLRPVTDDLLATGGKPTFLFVGAEFCPYCAGERWAVVQALSRFGTFSGLREISSSEDGIPTLDFRAATYHSKYLSVSLREIFDQSHHALQKLSAAEQAVYAKYSGGAYPFWYVSGGYEQVGAGFDVGVLHGLDQDKVAGALADPNTPVAKSVLGEANVITAATCKATGGRPAPVCGSGAIRSLTLPTSG
jgi:hypothetical protein